MKTTCIFLLHFFLMLCSCNLASNELIGSYSVEEFKVDTSIQKPIKELNIKMNGKAELVYADTIITRRWKEVDVQEFNFIELSANGEIAELHILKDSVFIRLYFAGDPKNFREGHYEALSFIKKK